MLKAVFLLCAVGTLHSVPLEHRAEEKCDYASCTKPREGFLNVHIVAHTHDDVGWLKTVDQYYYGSRNNIQKAGVQYILDSVVKELWEDPKRKFIYVETAFFWKWWVRQPDAIQQKVRTLVNEGRLQFVGGAWSMNDEANVNYQTTLDQFTWGLRLTITVAQRMIKEPLNLQMTKLNETFGHCGIPRVGWQIDPFGHSREFASLLASMGYDGLFLGRIDYQDKHTRLNNKNMEMVWRGDDALGASSDIFTGILFNTYSPPPGFCFDVLCNDEPIIDDPDSPMNNVEARISEFIDYVTKQSTNYRTNNVIVTMGGDFTYQDATMWYTNLDKLIKYTNLKSAKDGLNVTLFYSTPTCYLKAVNEANPTLPIKQDDFFPYASDPTAYWTGYFTSRPTTKYFERLGNNILQALKQLQVLAKLEKHNEFVLDELKSAMGVMQHHDAITGTEKQHVTSDYERILSQGIDDALIIASQAFNKIQNGVENPPILQYSRCRLNESSCHVSEDSQNFVVTLYNPLAFPISKYLVNIPVVGSDYSVYGPDGTKQKVQMYLIPDAILEIPTRKSKATHEIMFLTDLEPLALKSFYVETNNARRKRNIKDKRKYDYYNNINNYWKDIKDKTTVDIKNLEDIALIQNIPIEPLPLGDVEFKDFNVEILKDHKDDNVGDIEEFLKETEKRIEKQSFRRRSKEESFPELSDDEMRMLSDDPLVVERHDDANEFVLEFGEEKYNINLSNGNIIKIADDITPTYSIGFGYYNGTAGRNQNSSDRASGAYIFRPTSTHTNNINDCKQKRIEGDIFAEIQMSCSNLFSYVRVYGRKEVEIGWTVGPIDIEDGVGKEYVMKLGTNLITNGEVYTDSNGRQVLKRKLNKRPQYNVTIAEPVAGNYYPVSSHVFLESDDVPNRVVLIPDRPEGGASLQEGEIEMMLHRRLLYDDAFGVGEALNETAEGKGLVVRGSHTVLLHPTNQKDLRNKVLEHQLKPIILFADSKNVPLTKWKNLTNAHSFVKSSIPYGLHLLTFEPWDSKLLIRIENYMDAGNPDIEIDLNDVFKNIRFKMFKETVLSANQWLKDFEQMKWETESSFAGDFNKSYGSEGTVSDGVKSESVVDNGSKIMLKSQQIRTFIVDYEVV